MGGGLYDLNDVEHTKISSLPITDNRMGWIVDYVVDNPYANEYIFSPKESYFHWLFGVTEGDCYGALEVSRLCLKYLPMTLMR